MVRDPAEGINAKRDAAESKLFPAGQSIQNAQNLLPACTQPSAACFVLAGGRSTRMGQDKALIRFRGRSLVEIALAKLHVLGSCMQPRIAGSRPDLSLYAPTIDDLHPNCGPLSGIEGALASTSEPLNLFLPIDLPLVPAGFLAWILLRASLTGASITCPKINGRLEPLCAVYHRDVLPEVTCSLVAGEYKVTRILEAVRADASRRSLGPADPLAGSFSWPVDVFDVEQIASTCPGFHSYSPFSPHWWFRNCNTPEDLAELTELAEFAEFAWN